MILSRIRHTIPGLTASRRKLVLVCCSLPNKCWHYFNEFIGYRLAAGELGLEPIILGPRTIDADIAETWAAKTTLDPIPSISLTSPQAVINQLPDLVDIASRLESPWPAIEAEKVRRGDIIYFCSPHPILIQSAGLWLSRLPPAKRPSIFFRFSGAELVDPRTGKANLSAVVYRVVGKDLGTRPGHECVFFLANGTRISQAVKRVCDRRTFLMPLPKHYGDVSTLPVPPETPTAYLHFNYRSGRLTEAASDLIRRVRSVHPSTRFLVKFALGCICKGTIDRDIATDVELLPPEQSAEDYLSNFAKSSIVVLPYDKECGPAFNSGVLTEAASFGRPVVAPSESWMSQQFEEGNAAGAVYDDPTSGSIAAALIEAIQSLPQLSAAARKLAPHIAKTNSCYRALKLMLALAREKPDMMPRYGIGEEIDFSDPYDSRCFMRKGWSITEPSGAWTDGDLAELHLYPEGELGKPLTLSAIVHAYLRENHERLSVRVSCCGEDIAEWVFERGTPIKKRHKADIPSHLNSGDGRVLSISFAIDAPKSPFELGHSSDQRRLGLLFESLKLSLKETDRRKRPRG